MNTLRYLFQLVCALCFMALTTCTPSPDPQSTAPAPVSLATPSAATKELTSINPEFERALIPVADKVHVAIGYGASTFSFIEGDSGIILIDSGQLPVASGQALKAYRQISNKPIVAIIFTHSHGDHLNGAHPFFADGTVEQIWGRDNFGTETISFKQAGITINRVRGVRQAGFKLPPEKRINNGIAPAVYPKSKDAFNPANAVRPNQSFKNRINITIRGVALTLAQNDGETADQIYVWYPAKRIVFAGDNFYKSWPNLYAIRGTPYRDVKSWVAAVNTLLSLNADVLVGGHTRPILGTQEVREALTTYRDGINYVFTKTIEGINRGMTPDELVDYAQLPSDLANQRVLRPYYGHPDWAVRSIFNGYLGWFDGNPTNLFPLLPQKEAEKMVALAGGMTQMKRDLKRAMDNAEAQWACQLADYILILEPNNSKVMLMKADALRQLAENNVTATARNYYFTSAGELRNRARTVQPK